MKDSLKQLDQKAERYNSMKSKRRITWCDGCGNYGVQNALRRSVALEDLGVRDVMFCFDIGCSGNGSDKIEGYTAHGLHGRILPFAAGAAIANQDMQVVAEAGDGATLSEGINHLVHAIRNNFNMLFILHNNEIYGLTTGQASATTRAGCSVKGTPGTTSIAPINAMQLALSLNPSFLARAHSGDVDHMTELFRAGLNHNGFAMVEVFQACPTYNKMTPEQWYAERITDVQEMEEYDRTDIWQARKAVEEMQDSIKVGLLYENTDVPPFIASQHHRTRYSTTLVNEVEPHSIDSLY